MSRICEKSSINNNESMGDVEINSNVNNSTDFTYPVNDVKFTNKGSNKCIIILSSIIFLLCIFLAIISLLLYFFYLEFQELKVKDKILEVRVNDMKKSDIINKTKIYSNDEIRNIIDDINILKKKEQNLLLQIQSIQDEKKAAINNHKGIAICTIVKRENPYLKDWVEYYIKMGIDKIILYDNNEIDGEKLEDVFGTYIKSGYVKVIDYRYERFLQLQKAYRDCYLSNQYNFSWIFYTDPDEYLKIVSGIALRQFLEDSKFNDCEAVSFNWKIYGDNNLTYYENKSLLERFDNQESYVNGAVKTIVRGNLGQNVKFDGPHYPTAGVRKRCAPNGIEVRGVCITDRSNFNIAYIKHIETKTAEEFYWKMDRGMPELRKYEYIKRYADKIGLFFAVNIVTPEKLSILRPFLLYPGSYNKYYIQIYCNNASIYYVNNSTKKCPYFPEKNKEYIWA